MSNVIDAALRAPELRRLQAYVDRLVMMNQEACSTRAPGFLYRGLVYRHSSAKGAATGFPAVDPSLYDEIDEYLESQKAVEDDLQEIIQGLRPIHTSCLTLEDIRDALPECLVQLIGKDTGLSSLPRTRPEAWCLEPTGRGMRQYLKVLPKIEIYCAARLLY